MTDPYLPTAADLEAWLVERAASRVASSSSMPSAATRKAARRLVARVGPVRAKTKQEWMTAMKARLSAVGGRDG